MTDEENTTEAQEPEKAERLTKTDILKVLSNALKMGSITSRQAASMRAEMGVFGSDFTKKKTSQDKRKAKRKAQQKARAVTQRQGYKGQKPPSGRRKAA